MADSGGKTGTAAKDAPARKRRRRGDEVGSALKATYRNAIDEPVPQEMLDLLGKLT